MNNLWFMIASGLFVLSACFSVVAVIGHIKTRRMLREARHNIEQASKYEVLDTATVERKKGTITYPDMSEGPRYREYGDLS